MSLFGDPLKKTSFPAANNSAAGQQVAENNSELKDQEPNASVKNAKSDYASLGEQLVKQNLITPDQLEIAKKVQRETGGAQMIGNILVEMGFITEHTLSEVLSTDKGIDTFDPSNSIVDPDIVKLVPKELAMNFRAVPISSEDNKIYLAMVDIYDVVALDRLKMHLPAESKIVPMQCSQAALSDLIDNYYEYELSIDGILREIEHLNRDELVKQASNEQSYVNPTVRLLDAILIDAIRQGASDIHFEPEGVFVRVRYRIDGHLVLIRSFHIDYWSAVVVRIKIISGMNIAETRLPQDGRIGYQVLGREIDFRVSTQPTIDGENVVMRILDKKNSLLPMAKLGLSKKNIERLQKAMSKPEGIVVVTGPTGSGKTTTLYSILSEINDLSINIMTLEDPVEYRLPMIRQSNIRAQGGMDFAGGIKAALRQDPDVIFVGEVRDNETATLAMRASMTGHKVFTSLHTNDAIGAITRLIDIGCNPRVLSENIVAVIAQRLIRKLCDNCKATRDSTIKERQILGDDVQTVYAPEGCKECGGRGYKGRLAVTEIILIDEHLTEMIGSQASKGQMMKYIKENTGFISMALDGLQKVRDGVTDIKELARCVDITDRM